MPLEEDNRVFVQDYARIKGHTDQFEHDYVANQLLGGQLKKSNTVHHINSVKTDNRKENLLVFIDGNNHKRFHNSDYAYLIYDENTHLFSCEVRK